MNRPHFIIKNRFQKRDCTYQDLLQSAILRDVCFRLTGRRDYSVAFDNDGYNKGRLAELRYEGKSYFVTFSETEAGQGRNYSFQSVPSALNTWAIETYGTGNLYFYFLPTVGNYESAYFLFMYRLMRTMGIVFLNADSFLASPVVAFNSISDLSLTRDANRSRNGGNNSSYITIGEDRSVQIYAKTYGANKYESTLLGMALSRLTDENIDMYQICEGGLRQLPERSLQALDIVGGGRIKVIPTDMTMEINHFNESDSLRSPQYMYNLLALRGRKKCSLCRCDIPEIIQGAHIWGISQIKHTPGLSLDKKLKYALDGENGLWLCENHHKMFDANVISFNVDGKVLLRNGLSQSQKEFVKWVTPAMRLPEELVSSRGFRCYLSKRQVA
ncbi:MAG: HNH endonuclease [Kiritimatiellia bacterium]